MIKSISTNSISPHWRNLKKDWGIAPATELKTWKAIPGTFNEGRVGVKNTIIECYLFNHMYYADLDADDFAPAPTTCMA